MPRSPRTESYCAGCGGRGTLVILNSVIPCGRCKGSGKEPKATPPPPCDNCGERPGTEPWIGDLGALAFSHGGAKLWCRVCVLETQLEHARSRAAEIPRLERELEEARRG